MTSPVQQAAPRPSQCVGRDRELDRLTALLDEAVTADAGRVALISGPAFVGKGAVLEAFGARARDRRALCLHGRCSDGFGAAPYGPMLAALRGAVGVGESQDAATVAVVQAIQALEGRARTITLATPGQPDPLAHGSWELRRVALFESVARALGLLSRRAPVVLLIEDLHLADRATRELVAHLAQTRLGVADLDGSGLEGVGATEGGTGARMRGLLAVSSCDPDDAWLVGAAAIKIALEPLDLDGVRAFLGSPEVVAFFVEASGGRPRALEALLETRPAPADEILSGRLERLSVPAMALCRGLAVLGRPSSVELLAEVSEIAPESVGRSVTELSLASLLDKIVVDGELRLCFRRAADEEAIYRRLCVDDAVVRRLHARAGYLLSMRRRAGTDDAVTIAEHLLRGSAGETAVDAALEAGQRLELSFAYDRAVDLYRRAHAVTSRAEIAVILDERLAELLRMVGDYEGALVHAERLRRAVRDSASHRRVAQLHVLRDELDLALQAFGAAEELAADNQAELARVRAARAEAWFLAGRHAEAMAECARALELPPSDDVDANAELIQVRNTLGKVLLGRGQYARAAEIFAANVDASRATGRSFEECRALFNLGIAQLRLGHTAEAQARYQAALRVAETVGDHRNRAYCLQNLGVLAHWRNDYTTALAYFHDAATAFKTIGQRARLAWLALDLASVYLDLRALDRAEAMLQLAVRFADGQPPAAVLVDRDLLDARLRLAKGDVAGAAKLLESTRLEAEAIGESERAVDAALHLAKLELGRGGLERARTILASLGALDAQATRARAQLLRGQLELASGHADAACLALEEAADRFRRVGDLEGEWRAQAGLGQAAAVLGDDLEAKRRMQRAELIDARVLERVPEEMRVSHGADPERRALYRALGMPGTEPVLVPVIAAAPAVAVSEVSLGRMIGRHPSLARVTSLVSKVAHADSLVLIRGESGTGKELVAEAIVSASARRNKAFVKVNCGALVETLLLSELFGHERGAFTGALQRKKGRFEAADGGTIFLDEIGDISPKTQVALLRVLQEREFERVGGTTSVRVDVRILCATHRNLEQMVSRGEFREDLYYRLKGIQIELPSLRERADDLTLLADHFLGQVAEERGVPLKRLSSDAAKLLGRHDWPGNIRELENVIRSVSLFADGEVIEVRDFTDYVEVFRDVGDAAQRHVAMRPVETAPTVEPNQNDQTGGQSWARLCNEGLSLKELKRRVEIECITEALERAGGNITRAADLLGMKRPRLSQLIKEHGLGANEPTDPLHPQTGELQ